MKEASCIEIHSRKGDYMIEISRILYVLLVDRITEIHVSGGPVYQTRMTIRELEETLGEGFLKVHRGCLVSVRAIHDIRDRIILNNGETLLYTIRKKRQIIEQFYKARRQMIQDFSQESAPSSPEEYQAHYRSMDAMPFAFTDIEMVFNERRRAVDWIFRYGNEALARLERIPLKKLIGSSFGSLFRNMDSKWLRLYERAALYGETLEAMDYSPEIDTWLKVICFPTFRGHCGCILFPFSDVSFTRISDCADSALARYTKAIPEEDPV